MLANENFAIPERIGTAYAVLSELADERQRGSPQKPVRWPIVVPMRRTP